MLITTIIMIFIVAVLLGFTLLFYVLKNKNTPKGIAFIHGPIAFIGVVILLIYAILNSYHFLISVLLFLLAAGIGVLLIYRDLTGQSIPKWLAVLHGSIAAIALFILILFAFLYL